MNKMSKGEEKIASMLLRAGITFKTEVSFSNLNGDKGRPLRFDFALYNKKGILQDLIEYDGIQHFKYTPHFHSSKLAFKRQIEWDRKKNKFCLLNKIPLLRIPYWDLDKLTIYELFTNPSYRVINKEHNLLLIQQGVIK